MLEFDSQFPYEARSIFLEFELVIVCEDPFVMAVIRFLVKFVVTAFKLPRDKLYVEQSWFKTVILLAIAHNSRTEAVRGCSKNFNVALLCQKYEKLGARLLV